MVKYRDNVGMINGITLGIMGMNYYIYGGFLNWSYPKLAGWFISWKIP